MPKESGILHVMYGSRKYAHPHHRESLEILRGRRIFKGKYKPNVEFPEGWGFKPKKLLLGESMDIFWNNTICTMDCIWEYQTSRDNKVIFVVILFPFLQTSIL